VLCLSSDLRGFEVRGTRIRVSLGTSVAAGLASVRCQALPTTAYLMIGSGCMRSCAFCSQGKASSSRPDTLSRVTWPEYDADMVLPIIRRSIEGGLFERACLQVLDDDDSESTVHSVLTQLAGLPVAVSFSPRNLRAALNLRAAGADHLGIPLDAASPRIHEIAKKGMSLSWHGARSMIIHAASVLPGRVTTHLIVGLGETEQEMVECMEHFSSNGVRVALFAFTPARGTPMEGSPPPPLHTYRLMQTALHLIRSGLVRSKNLRFGDGGHLLDFGVSQGVLKETLQGGEAFRTSGCPGCNRPYYNERPGSRPYNYPRPLTPEEAAFEENAVFRALEERGMRN